MVINNTCPIRNMCDQRVVTCNCDGCSSCYVDFNKPKKKLVLVGRPNRRRAHTFMDLVTDLLSKGEERVDIVRIDWDKLIFETPHVEVRFFLEGDREERLTGLNADAIFCDEYPELLRRAKPGAIIASKYGGTLTGYIRWIEREAIDFERSNAGWFDNAIIKRMLNSVYGKPIFARGNGKYPLSADVVRELFEHAEKAGVLKPTLRKIPEITQEDIDKMLQSPFDDRGFIQRQIYNALLKGENNMATSGNIYIQRDTAGTRALADAFANISRSLRHKLPGIKTVHFSGPVTAVIWEDKTKTIVRCKDGDEPDYEKGLAMAIAKKALGTNKSGSNYYDIFKQWLPKPEEDKQDA